MALKYFADAVELGRLDIHQLSWILPMALVQHGLGVKGVDMGDPAIHVEKNYTFGPRRKMRLPGQKGVEGRVAILA